MAAAEKARESILLRSPERLMMETLPPDGDTLPKQFVLRAQERPDAIAMRKKRYGIWQETTWAESLCTVRYLSLGLLSLGVQRGECAAIIGENDPEFYWAQFAAWSAGAITTAIFTDANAGELEYILTNSDAAYLFAHDQEQVDKALMLRPSLPNIRRVIYWDERGLWNARDSWLMSYAALIEAGRIYEADHAGEFEAQVAAGRGSDIALFSYTSGTTTQPKGAMISHANLMFGNLHKNSVAPSASTDNYVSFSPLAWITEQSLGVPDHALFGVVVNFPESPETVATDLREIAPSTALFPSRVWENLASTMQIRIHDSTWINRALYRAFLPVSYRVADLQDARQPVPLGLSLLARLGDLAVFQPLRDKIGMTKMRNAFTSGAALSPDVLRFFRAVGVELKNLYGSTECQTHTMHYDSNIKLHTVGAPAPGVEVQIRPDGELWIRSRSVFAGYHKDAAKTAEALDADGWFHTGDAGYTDEDGHIIYLDRLSDMLQLANGERFSPQYIEGRLKFSPYIHDAMAVGGADTDYVTAIINIDFDNVVRWAEKRRLSFTTFVDLSQKPEVYDLIRQDVARVNATLPPAARVRKFVILHKTFDADEAELTRTRKLRRRALEQKYRDMLDAMYGNRESVTVRAEVKYRDGRVGTVETAVRVCEMEQQP